MFLGVDVDSTSSSPASKDTVLRVLRKQLMSRSVFNLSS